MGRKLFVGNLPYVFDNFQLESFFEQAGPVTSAKVIYDRDSGRSKGFGFVEMANEKDANEAIQKLNGVAVAGRNILVSEARPPKERY